MLGALSEEDGEEGVSPEAEEPAAAVGGAGSEGRRSMEGPGQSAVACVSVGGALRS